MSSKLVNKISQWLLNRLILNFLHIFNTYVFRKHEPRILWKIEINKMASNVKRELRLFCQKVVFYVINILIIKLNIFKKLKACNIDVLKVCEMCNQLV